MLFEFYHHLLVPCPSSLETKKRKKKGQSDLQDKDDMTHLHRQGFSNSKSLPYSLPSQTDLLVIVPRFSGKNKISTDYIVSLTRQLLTDWNCTWEATLCPVYFLSILSLQVAIWWTSSLGFLFKFMLKIERLSIHLVFPMWMDMPDSFE